MKFSKWFLVLALTAFLHIAGWGQGLTFRFLLDGKLLTLDSMMELDGVGPVTIETLRFYVSDMALGAHRGLSPQQHHLVDAAEPGTWVMDLEGMGARKDSVVFKLGIDSLTNVSGALGGDLDPTKGMYWAWQSGYINLKIEGTSPFCPARNHRFQFHLGGYAGALNALQVVRLPLQPGWGDIVVEVDCGQMLRQLDLSKEYEVMSPSLRAVELSRLAVGMFRVAE